MIAAVFLAILCLGLASAAPTPDYSLDAEWEEWKRSFEKTYSQVGHMATVGHMDTHSRSHGHTQ